MQSIMRAVAADAEVPERLMRGDRGVLHIGGLRRGGCLRQPCSRCARADPHVK